MKQFFLFCSLLFLWGINPQAHAQADCANALAINTAGSFTANFDNTADFLVAYNGGTAPNNGQYTCAATPGLGDVWFTYSPGGSNLVQNDLEFSFSPNFNGTFNIFLFYSESFEIGDPCEFPSGTVLTGLTRYQLNECNLPINAGPGNTYEMEYFGLDGSGQYLILVERVSGNNGGNEQMTITATLTGTCPAPANDACATPALLTVGNGIDPNYNTANVSAWTDALKGTNSCATKERLFDQCTGGLFGNPPTPTEDHYGAYIGIGSTCIYTGNIGDVGPLNLGLAVQADQFIENTVYFQVDIPNDAPVNTTWYLNMGSNGFCSTAPNDMAVMVFSSLDCNDADNSARIATQKMNVSPSLPTPLHTFSLPFTNPGDTYYIVVDGTRGSQCDFCMLLTTNIVDPVLPATVENLNGWNEGPRNVLNWETSLETQHDYFRVERSLDGENFTEIGIVDGVGESSSIQEYSFVDTEAPFGEAVYRLAIVDINGGSYNSDAIEVFRDNASFGLHEVYPVPFRNELIVEFSTESDQPMYVRLYDVQGKMVVSDLVQPQAGTNRVKLQTEALPSGLYVLRLEQNGNSQIKKVIK